MIDAIGKISEEEFEKLNQVVKDECKRMSTMTNEEILTDLKNHILEEILEIISDYKSTKNINIINSRIKRLENDLNMIKVFDVDDEPLAEDFRSFLNVQIDELKSILDKEEHNNEDVNIQYVKN